MELRDVDAILIDGRSGSGKTVLAAQVATRLGNEGGRFQVLHVEDLYPGWTGLAEGSRAVARALQDGGYRRYDWRAEEFAEWVPLTFDRPLVVEGCGAVTRQNLDAVSDWATRAREIAGSEESPRITSVWLECEAEERRERALARDGDTFRPYWDIWAEQEDALYAETEPCSLADEVLVSPSAKHATERVRAAWSAQQQAG